MIKDIFFSFRENIKQKTTNPFFGTLIIVWIIHNWELVFTFFNFESGNTLKQKIEFLSKYLETKPFLINIGICILVTFIVLISTYLFLNLSRIIVNLYEKRLTPWVYKITDYKSIVLKSTYDNLVKERDLLSSKLDSEREAKLRLQNEISNLEEKLKEKLIEEPKLDQEIKLTDNTKNEENSRITRIVNDIINKGFSDDFEKIITHIVNREYILLGNLRDKINYFLRADIIMIESGAPGNDSNKKRYHLTEFGMKVKNEFIDTLMKNK